MKRHPNSFMIVDLRKTRLKEKKVSNSIILFFYLFLPCKKTFMGQINKSILDQISSLFTWNSVASNAIQIIDNSL